MTDRNLSPHVFLERTAADHQPAHTFRGRSAADFKRWRKALLPKVVATLGSAPRRVPPRPQLLAEWREDGLIKQRWVIDVQPHLSATLLVFRPDDLKRGERRPALLCCHGHGTYGKDSVMGIVADDGRAAEVKRFNYDYGLRMAQAGFVTFALDWLGFGERSSRAKPYYYQTSDCRDPCNLHYLSLTMLGTTVLASNCHDGSRATDFVCSLPFVDGDRLGVMGLSYGGTMTTFMALTDPRFIAADVICYAGPFRQIGYRTYNSCGSQVAPGLYALCDMADLHGLIAPRPLLMEMGIHDACFHIDEAINEHYPHVEKVYKAAGAADRLELDMFPGEHAWGSNKSVPFFRRAFGMD